MPKLDLTLPEDALSTDARESLPGRMLEAMLRWEGAPDTAFFRSISWVHVHKLPADAMHTGDGVAPPHAVIDVTIPDGALSERRKAGLVEDLTKLVLEATGWGDDAALRVWVVVHEIPDGSWAAAGEIVRFEQLREAAAREREGTEAPA